jgi:SET domain-containing protein
MNAHLETKVLRDLQPWFASGLSVQPSSIHGRGLFAHRPFSTGDVLIRLGGFFLRLELRRTSAVIPSTSTAVAEEVILTELQNSEKDLSDFLNHSCEPNAGFADAITLVATRAITAGEEITIDYVYCEADEKWKLKNPCACKAPSCRGEIKGSDWRNPALSSRFLLWASPFIKRRIYQLQTK